MAYVWSRFVLLVTGHILIFIISQTLASVPAQAFTADELNRKIHKTAIIIRHSKFLNKVVEQDHRAVKRLTRPMLGVKSFWAAQCTLAGIEVMHAIRKGQVGATGTVSQTPGEQFYALAA